MKHATHAPRAAVPNAVATPRDTHARDVTVACGVRHSHPRPKAMGPGARREARRPPSTLGGHNFKLGAIIGTGVTDSSLDQRTP